MVKVMGPVALALVALTLLQGVMSSWDFAVTTNGKIIFYNAVWNETTSAAHQFEELSAIAFDETDDTLYFNDQAHNNGSLFSLKLSKDDDHNHHVEKVLQKTKDELVQGIAFDPLDRMLYWTDSKNKKIFRMSVEKSDHEPIVWLQLNDTQNPQGIAVDVCRRKIYWTNSNHRNPTIERASMDGSKREVIVRTNLFIPLGITVDQFTKRLYWVDDQQGNHFSVESSALDGTDRKTLVRSLYNAPLNLAVDEYNVYWTDYTHNAIWKMAKNGSDTDKPEQVKNFDKNPNGIISRDNLLSTQVSNPDCRVVVKEIKDTVLLPSSVPMLSLAVGANENDVALVGTVSPKQLPTTVCLNRGDLNRKTNMCMCPNEYTGVHCEIPICHNYCVDGSCHVTSTGYAQCTCFEGYTGDRCERDMCTGYCLNGGRCEFENDEPVCHCLRSFSGRHCERLDEEIMCRNYCNDGIVLEGIDLQAICKNCSSNSTMDIHNSVPKDDIAYQQSPHIEELCGKTSIIVSASVVTSLFLALLIVLAFRFKPKQLRPSVKKTFVVHKNVRSTPLTCRPDQVEITIENCCNGNICDTPCFDPKKLQQDINNKETRKDDKCNLLANMEGDLY